MVFLRNKCLLKFYFIFYFITIKMYSKSLQLIFFKIAKSEREKTRFIAFFKNIEKLSPLLQFDIKELR